jgi:competence protein ComEA
MPFIESAESLKSKLHLSEASSPILIGIVALGIVAVILVCQNVFAAVNGTGFALTRQSSTSSVGSSQDSGEQDASSKKSVKQIKVFVSGAVIAPGVYTLDEGMRVQDAVDAAGGFAPDAAMQALNLARALQDGEQINIVTVTSTNAAESGAGGADAPSSPTATSATASVTTLVNINKATAQELETLPGIGAATAQKIVANRTDEGPFVKKEDLKRVSGIGDKKYAALEDYITVG